MLTSLQLQFLHGQPDTEAEASLTHHLQPETYSALCNLQEKAASDNFNLQIASGYRSFDRQLAIWNRKAKGESAILDSDCKPLDRRCLSDREAVFAILRWSALPGASRHHWGTDIDVYDANAKPDGYDVQLTDEEVTNEGMFGALHQWLDKQIEENAAFGFFRPYGDDTGGIAPERWHLSFGPLSRQYQAALSSTSLASLIQEADIELKDCILDNLEEIYQRFINIPINSQ